MRTSWQRAKKILPLLIAFSTGASFMAACATGKRYIICVADPAHDNLVCNQTGLPQDNYNVGWKMAENYQCMPPVDAQAMQQELVVCRQGKKP